LSGADGPTAIERWAQAKQDWLQRILELPNGIPSHDCIRRVLLALKPEAVQKCFEKWIASCLMATSDSRLEEDSPAPQIALDGGGDYVLAVKQNQPKLYEAIESFFESPWANDDWAGGPCHHRETHEQGHGRMEDRYYYLAKIPDDESVFAPWPGLRAIGMAIRVTEKEGKTTEDVRYYIVRAYLSGVSRTPCIGNWT
jgi:hypothetical protein